MGKGLDFDQLFPGRFLKAGMFQGRDVTLTIAEVVTEKLAGDKGEEVKGIVKFRERPQHLVLNKTNGLCIKAMFGRDTGEWVGKRITFYAAPIDFGDAEIAIRVRGSPDLPRNMEAEIKLARKKPRKVVLQRTNVGGARPAARPTQSQANRIPPPPVEEDPHADSEPPMPSDPPPPSDEDAPGAEAFA